MEEHPPLIPPIKGGKLPLHVRKKGIRMDTEKRLAKRLDFLKKSTLNSFIPTSHNVIFFYNNNNIENKVDKNILISKINLWGLLFYLC